MFLPLNSILVADITQTMAVSIGHDTKELEMLPATDQSTRKGGWKQLAQSGKGKVH